MNEREYSPNSVIVPQQLIDACRTHKSIHKKQVVVHWNDLSTVSNQCLSYDKYQREGGERERREITALLWKTEPINTSMRKRRKPISCPYSSCECQCS
jgi:hypothetical protein